jgi:hypothetical protein
MNRFDRYVSALWQEYKLWGFVVLVVLAVAIAYIFGIDVGGYVNRWLGL